MGSTVARRAPSYVGLKPASDAASRAARGASRKQGTLCEVLLRRELWKRGLRYRLNVGNLPGRPDLVFVRERVAVFCDGDFWHGRNLVERVAKLKKGHNAGYWVAKVQANVARDERQTLALEADGWRVLRLWETEMARDVSAAADVVAATLKRKADKS